jgi:hypothetical protein
LDESDHQKVPPAKMKATGKGMDQKPKSAPKEDALDES